MNNIKKTENYLKNLNINLSPQQDQTIFDNLNKILKESKNQPAAKTQPNIWRITMNSKITKFTAAAVIIIGVIIGLWIEAGVSSKVYGMNDVPEMIKKAKFIHTRAWISDLEILPTKILGEEDHDKHYIEEWYDLENERYRSIRFGELEIEDNLAMKIEIINDGQYEMQIEHGLKTGQFLRRSKDKQKLAMHNVINRFLNRITLTPDELHDCDRIDDEVIEGTAYDIWQYDTSDDVLKTETIFKFWVSPDTGKIRKIRRWNNGDITGGTWQLTFEQEIEIDIAIPEGIFDTIPPTGYHMDNTKETANFLK